MCFAGGKDNKLFQIIQAFFCFILEIISKLILQSPATLILNLLPVAGAKLISF
jgi:hypothetical protein